jgi:hypothetical protein
MAKEHASHHWCLNFEESDVVDDGLMLCLPRALEF